MILIIRHLKWHLIVILMEGTNWVLKAAITDRGSRELYNFVSNIILHLKSNVVLCHSAELFGNLWLWAD